MNHVLEIYALFMLLGCVTTYFIPETARKTLEELSGEHDYATTVQNTSQSDSLKGEKLNAQSAV